MRATAVLLLLSACSNPAAPTPTHPQEVALVGITNCYAAHLGFTVEVEFSDEKYMVPCGWPKPDDRCPAAGWSYPNSGLVTYYRPWVHEASRLHLRAVASHEIAHASGIWNEEMATAFAETYIEECQ